MAADFLYNYIFVTVGRVGSSTDLIMQHVEYIQGGLAQRAGLYVACVAAGMVCTVRF